MLTKLSLVVLLLCISACIQVRDPKKDAQDRKNAPVSVPKISYEIVALPQPHRYLVRFIGLGPETLVQRNSTDKQGQIQLQAVTGQDEVIEKGGHYEYRFQVQGHEQRLEVRVPEDVVIENERNLEQMPTKELKANSHGLQKYLKIEGRLYFKPQSVLITNGQRVLIEADSIESDGGRLQSYSPKNLNVLNQDGADGGSIYLKSKSLKGTLEIHLLGQTGIVQLPHSRIDGYNGGNSGQLWAEIVNMDQGFLRYFAGPGKAGKGVKQFVFCFKSQNNCPVPKMGSDGRAGVAQLGCLVRENKCEPLPFLTEPVSNQGN